MKFIKAYEKIMKCSNSNDVFNHLIKTLKSTNRTFDYFVDWEKVLSNVKNVEMELNLLNYLSGKEDIKNEFEKLIKRYPTIVPVIPLLLAMRDKSIPVLIDAEKLSYKEYFFNKKDKYSDKDIKNIIEFCDKVGILDLLKGKKLKNLVDYCTGVEVGTDTNSRKNRSGIIMENIIHNQLDKILSPEKIEFISQATVRKVKNKWGIELPIDKSSRRYDFVVKHNKKLILIETNFYSVGGSKLKATAGEYISLNEFLLSKNVVDKFIWITDGKGWIKTTNPLKEAFEKIDYLLNLDMVFSGILQEILFYELEE